MSKIITTLCFIFLIAGCRYQKQGLSPLEESFVTFGTLQGNLESFYSLYIKTPLGEKVSGPLPYENPSAYDTRVDYEQAFKDRSSPQYRNLRESILGHIAAPLPPQLPLSDKIAFHINAYNFLAIDIVIENSKGSLINSITDLGGQNSFRAFSDTQNFGYKVAGSPKKISLDTIEKVQLKELTRGEDSRLHFAVICASESCPVLLHRPYSGALLEQQLDFATRAGLHKSRLFQNQADQQTSLLSSIFDWYFDDFIADINREFQFESDELYIEAFIKKYLGANTVFFPASIDFLDYDWTLNKVESP